jgi:uncharacterized protein DUF3800
MIRHFLNWASDQIERWQLGAPYTISPTGALGLSLCLRWDPERIFVIVNAYADESGTHSPDYQMLAGYVAKLGRWNAFDVRWRRRLAKEGLKYFHLVEHTRKRDLQPMCWDLLKMCGKYLECGFVIRLDKKSYDEFYIAGLRPRQQQLDTIYGVCYRYMIGFLVRELPQLLGRDDLQINIMLELGAPGSRDAERIHAQIKQDVPNESKIIGELSFGEKKKFPGLQAADSLAHPAFREEKKLVELLAFPTGTIKHARRATKSSAIPPIFRVHLEDNTLGALKKDILVRIELEELARRSS